VIDPLFFVVLVSSLTMSGIEDETPETAGAERLIRKWTWKESKRNKG
jgi:hypothetical protein